MKTYNVTVTLLVILTLIFSVSVAVAGDFDWTRDLNVRAEADRDGFRAQLSTRFHVGGAQVNVVLGNVDSPADAYMVFRLGEMSSKPMDYVLNKYRGERTKGWGVLAKSLGIKPGSREFHALKQGSDLYEHPNKRKGHGKKKGRG